MLLDSTRLESQADRFSELLRAERIAEAARAAIRVSDMRAARILQEYPIDTVLAVMRHMGWPRAGRCGASLPLEVMTAVVLRAAQDSEDDAGSLLEELPPQMIHAVLERLPENLQQALRAQLDREFIDEVDQLANYPEDSAGATMSPYFLTVRPDETVADLRTAVREAPPEVAGSAYIFVENGDGRLTGVISLRELVITTPGARIADVMSPDVFAIRAGDEAIEAARRIRSRGLKLLPVVDDNDCMVGVISMQQALDLLAHDVADDFVALGAASVDESFFTPPRRSVGKRLPWMAANVFLNLGAVAVISSFEDTIVQVAILAAFLPMITDMGGNVGIQALSVSIRSMALGEARLRDVWRSLRKEIYVGVCNGLALGVLFGVIVLVMQQNVALALVAGIALASNVLVAGVVGGTIPFVIKRLGRDPAMMTGPVLTTITDITGVSIYLGLSTLFLAAVMATGG